MTLPEVKPGAIGLGLDEFLMSLRRLGATTYEKWFEQGLTQVRPEEANLSSYNFERAFSEAANKALQIVFDLRGMDVARALEQGSRGFVNRNYTNAELHRILNNPKWLSKTTFLKYGQVMKPVIQNGKVTCFAPKEE
jgi:alpha-amylase/alpha-mannosidase (GH57 family)